MKKIKKQILLAGLIGTLLTACGTSAAEDSGLISMETAVKQSHTVMEDKAPEPTAIPTAIPNTGGDPTGEPQTPAVPDRKDGEFEETNDTVYVAVSKLNLRSLPSTDSEVVGTAVYGDSFTRIAKGTNSWDRLLYEGQVVYAYADYLTTDTLTGRRDDVTVESMTADVKKNSVL